MISYCLNESDKCFIAQKIEAGIKSTVLIDS